MKRTIICATGCFICTWLVTHTVKDAYLGSVLGNFCYFFWGISHDVNFRNNIKDLFKF